MCLSTLFTFCCNGLGKADSIFFYAYNVSFFVSILGRIDVVSNVSARALIPAASVATPQVRAPNATVPGPTAPGRDGRQQAAQAFINALPSDVRDRVVREDRPQVRRDDAQQSQQQNDNRVEAEQTLRPERETRAPHVGPVVDRTSYSAPLFISNLTLLQAQLGVEESDEETNVIGSAAHAQRQQAYVAAGAQPGGETAAREAALKREELGERMQVVPPVLSTINVLS